MKRKLGVCGLCLGCLAWATSVLGAGTNIVAGRLGVYDSRVVAYAWFWGAAHQAQLKEQMAAARAAKQAGDEAKLKEDSAALSALQDQMHREVFSTAPANEALEMIKERIPEIEKTAGVSNLVSKWDGAALANCKGALQVDVTDALVREFLQPTEKQLKVIESIKKAAPVPFGSMQRIDSGKGDLGRGRPSLRRSPRFKIPIEEKSNEIPALKPLLQKIQPPPGTLITTDAIHCRQEGARFITQELGGDYLFGLKGNQSVILDKAERLRAQQGFPPQGQWEKGHGRLEHRRLARVAVTPEEIGLCGCWQVIAVERELLDLTKPAEPAARDIGCYTSSLAVDQADDQAILAAVRSHWSASENGTHYRRDVSLGEDACRTTKRQGAAVLASLRNLAIGIYELEKAAKRTKVDTSKSWFQQQTFSTLWPILRR